jgi:hypothetical protein
VNGEVKGNQLAAAQAGTLFKPITRACANDVSERPIQFSEMEAGCLLIGKGFDTFCPLGPVIATWEFPRA